MQTFLKLVLEADVCHSGDLSSIADPSVVDESEFLRLAHGPC